MIQIPIKQKKYRKYRQVKPNLFIKKSFRTVPLNHSKYKGQKFKKHNYSGTTAKAVVGKLRKTKKWSTQSILIPKK